MGTNGICFGAGFAEMLSVLLTGSPDDGYVHTLVRQAMNGEITNNDLFLRLTEKYGSSQMLLAAHKLVSDANAKRERDELPGRSEIKSVCGVCITPSILGRIISMKQRYSGEDSRYIESLIERISAEGITIEDALTELIVRFGRDFVDGFTQINRDTDTVYNEAKRRALERNPVLKNAIG